MFSKIASQKLYCAIFFVVAFFGITLSLNIANPQTAQASFNVGNIIDEGTFTNYNSMNAAQIQTFLNNKNSVCLKNFRAQSLVDDNGDGVVQDSTTEPYGRHGTMSAAEIINAAAKIYRINPQVLLVTLQKEQSLITGSDCSNMSTALGYGCPDSTPGECAADAKGFTRQIDYGAYHFRGYFDDSLNYVPFGVGNYNIAYNPNPSCGSSTVNIQNRSTASLYSYTPYQPNAAALAAGYGTAPCGAYGNRNFYLFFTDWFGSTQGGAGYAEITNKYNDLGGVNSWLGAAVGDTKPTNKGGLYRQFENGKIYWHKNTVAKTIRKGAIDNRYAAVGYESSYLGFPKTDEITIPGKGVYQQFEGGQMYWSSSTGAWDIHYGAMFNRFRDLGYESSYLGFPTSGEIKAGKGTYQNFQGGRLYWRPLSESMDIPTNLLNAYITAGSENGYLGLPNKSTACNLKDNGCWMRFDGGKIYWSTGSGAFDIHSGAVDGKYAELNYESGTLGYPRSREIPTGNTCGGYKDVKQEFQNGTIQWSKCSNPTAKVE